jgi:uncharacterized membrane protein YbaN (DUF454 family)
MKKSTAILIIFFTLSCSFFFAKTEIAKSDYFTSVFAIVSTYFIVKTLEEKL